MFTSVPASPPSRVPSPLVSPPPGLPLSCCPPWLARLPGALASRRGRRASRSGPLPGACLLHSSELVLSLPSFHRSPCCPPLFLLLASLPFVPARNVPTGSLDGAGPCLSSGRCCNCELRGLGGRRSSPRLFWLGFRGAAVSRDGEGAPCGFGLHSSNCPADNGGCQAGKTKSCLPPKSR